MTKRNLLEEHQALVKLSRAMAKYEKELSQYADKNKNSAQVSGLAMQVLVPLRLVQLIPPQEYRFKPKYENEKKAYVLHCRELIAGLHTQLAAALGTVQRAEEEYASKGCFDKWRNPNPYINLAKTLNKIILEPGVKEGLVNNSQALSEQPQKPARKH